MKSWIVYFIERGGGLTLAAQAAVLEALTWGVYDAERSVLRVPAAICAPSADEVVKHLAEAVGAGWFGEPTCEDGLIILTPTIPAQLLD